MSRRSLHVEPVGPLQIARHYIRELIYGANDGIISTFAFGASRALIANVRWWRAGLQMLSLGAVVRCWHTPAATSWRGSSATSD